MLNYVADMADCFCILETALNVDLSHWQTSAKGTVPKFKQCFSMGSNWTALTLTVVNTCSRG
jgi:hypothetical protein